jgi:hypothetical protein
MTNLSPAAQAVIHEYSKIAYDNNVGLSFTPLPWEQKAIAAAIRAAADQCTYRDAWNDKFLSVEKLLAIAAELEAQ